MNFVHKSCSKEEVINMFGDHAGEIDGDVIQIDDNTKLEDILVIHLKKFPSKTQCRKAGWNGPIPDGFKEWRISKTFFWTYKPISWDEELEENKP